MRIPRIFTWPSPFSCVAMAWQPEGKQVICHLPETDQQESLSSLGALDMHARRIGRLGHFAIWPGFRMTRTPMTHPPSPTRILISVTLLTVLVVAGGCGSSSPTQASIAPTIVSDTFTGTINPMGTDSHNFTVTYAAAATNASVTVTSLASVADQTPQAITIGVGFGYLNLGVCNVQLSNPAATIGTELPTTTSPFQSGTYCVQIFDNQAAPTVSTPMTYGLTVKHY
jgi:hypothetical protein